MNNNQWKTKTIGVSYISYFKEYASMTKINSAIFSDIVIIYGGTSVRALRLERKKEKTLNRALF